MKENPVHKMEFPEFISVKPKEQIGLTEYKEMIEKEIVIQEKPEEGMVTIREGKNNTIEMFPKKQVEEIIIDELDEIILTQEKLDEFHEQYKNNYIQLYGEDEYNKIYSMTESHLYPETESEEEEDNDEEETD
jgi:GTP1/Obg family GTP-binding protein